MKKFLFLATFSFAPAAFAGSATIFNDFQSSPYASGSATINFNSYNATSITISVNAQAYGASQQGGGRNYRGYAEAVIGSSKSYQDVPDGSDPLSVWASNSLTVTKGGDGNWYSGGTNMGGGVTVSAFAWVDGENAVGSGSAYCSISWVDAPANSAPTISWNSPPSTIGSGQSYSISAHGHDNDGNLADVRVWKDGTGFAFGGGGNGYDNDSGNTTSDTGPKTITFTAQAFDSSGATSSTITHVVTISAPANTAPTIAWVSAPGTAASGASYTITAGATDADGNLADVRVWKDGTPFAFGGAGNGFSNNAGNTTSDTGPKTVMFTAQAFDSSGATSSTITHVVSISAPPNAAPTIAWVSAPSAAASGVDYTITARGTDPDGNLADVRVWKDGGAFAFGGGGNGFANNSGNTTSDIGPKTVTFTAQSFDSSGATSTSITHTVTISAPPAVSASISASPTSASAPGSTTVSWSSANATSVSVSGNGISSSVTSGSQSVSGLGAGTYTYTITAQGYGGPVTQSATFTVNAPASVAASIAASPGACPAPGTSTISWSSANATSVSVSGTGLSSTAANGSQTITGLSAGNHSYTITAQGPNGPVTQTCTVTVSAPSMVSGSISASPTTGTAPGSTTISWNTQNATSVSVSGAGLNSTAPNGSQTVTGLGAGTYSYTLTAQGPGGPITRTATFTVSATAPAVSGSISATPTNTTTPGSTTISWTTANATSASITGNGINSTATSGSQTVTGLAAGTYTYTLTAQGNGGPITRTATVIVNAPAPTVAGSISANPTTSMAPGSSTISWSTSGATSVSVTGPGLNSTASSGSQSVTGLAAGTHTYTLTANGNGGPITRTATVTVDSGAGVTGSISVSPTTMSWGGTAVLTWNTANATSVKVSGYGITGTPYQSYSSLTIYIGGLNPGETTWTLIAEGPGGPITRTATINVTTSDGLYGSITANPTVIYSNQTATLNWTTTGTNFRWVHGYSPGMNGVNIYPAPVNGSTAVSGLAPGDYRFTIEYGPGSSTTRMSFADLTVLGINRTVTTSVSPAGIGSVSGGGTYAEGANATLTANANATHVFTGWSGDLGGSSNPLTFTVGPQNYNVTANFAPRTYTVTAAVSPAGAGTVSGAGVYSMGGTATLTATADATHVFSGWSGDLSSPANPLSFTVNGDTNLTANFAPTSFTLTTAASSGGSVTPGGTYPSNTTVTITATPDATHRFTGWSGDVSGTAVTIPITLDRDKFARADFTGKTPQTITFPPPGDRAVSSPPFTLSASASSGLPVSFTLLGGPATLLGDQVEITGSGPITIQADQPGDSFYLPATPVAQTFNAIAPAILKYRPSSRINFRNHQTREGAPFVLEKP